MVFPYLPTYVFAATSWSLRASEAFQASHPHVWRLAARVRPLPLGETFRRWHYQSLRQPRNA